MAWSSTDLSADYQSWLAQDKPLIGVRDVLSEAETVQWRDNGAGSRSDGDEARAFDGKTSLATSPNTGTLLHNMYIGRSSPSDFDFVALIFDNPTLLDFLIRVQIADDNLFTVNAEVIGSYVVTGKRAALISFGDSGNTAPNTYSGVEHLRIRFSHGATAFTPAIREIFIGTRVQLEHNPRIPWDNKGLVGNTAKSTSHSGEQTRYVYAKGKREVIANLNPGVDARADDIESIYTLSDYGNAPMIWIDNPSSAQHDFNLVHQREPTLLMPYVGPFERTVTLDLEEQGPHYLALEV